MTSQPSMSAISDALAQRMVALRRDLHAHPELSMQEIRTGRVIADGLRAAGYDVTTGVAETGVIATLRGARPGRHIVLRADMDALPLQEATGLPYASQTPDVMHACGHDGHTAMLFGAALALREQPPAYGQVTFLFQPAEEKSGGARRVMDGQWLKEPELFFAFHIDPRHPVGEVVVQSGPVSGWQDSVTVEVRGKGGHAARPHLAVDAILLAADFLVMAQSAVSRRANPAAAAVFTIGNIQGGQAANIIADHVTLRGTLRTQEPSTRQAIIDALQGLAANLGQSRGGQITVTIREGAPAVINSEPAVGLARAAAAAVVGEKGIVGLLEPNLASEDFSYYLTHAKGCYMRLGARIGTADNPPIHSATFNFDEAALRVGAAIWVQLAQQATVTGA